MNQLLSGSKHKLNPNKFSCYFNIAYLFKQVKYFNQKCTTFDMLIKNTILAQNLRVLKL